jgi:hypothetical protein
MIVCAECESWKPEEGKCMRGILGASPSFACQLGKARKPAQVAQVGDVEGQGFLFQKRRRFM